MKTADVVTLVNKLAPQLLDGLASAERVAVLEEAALRRLRANSVIARGVTVQTQCFCCSKVEPGISR